RRDRPVLGPGLHRRPGGRRDRRGAHHQVPVPRADARPGRRHRRPARGGRWRSRCQRRQGTHDGRELTVHIGAIGGSDAGISAALRAREVDPGVEFTVVAADAYPNFSICGIPYYVSGEVTHWRNLAHRTYADLEAAGMRLRLDTTARKVDVAARELHAT